VSDCGGVEEPNDAPSGRAAQPGGGAAGRSRRAPARRWARSCAGVAACGVAVVLGVGHTVRGTPVARPSDEQYALALARAAAGGALVQSQEAMNDLGALAYRVVEASGRAPGPFYVHHLPRLDLLERLRHVFHGPFTGLRSIYADVWINSCTTYGARESTWPPGRAAVYPADKLSILVMLIDRLKREKSGAGEHFGAYLEMVRGMELHTVRGRATCYVLLVEACAADPDLAAFVHRQLGARDPAWVDPSERELWRLLAAAPTYETLAALARGARERAAPAPLTDASALFRAVVASRAKTATEPGAADRPGAGDRR